MLANEIAAGLTLAFPVATLETLVGARDIEPVPRCGLDHSRASNCFGCGRRTSEGSPFAEHSCRHSDRISGLLTFCPGCARESMSRRHRLAEPVDDPPAVGERD